MGLNAIETYVPWNLHEPQPGNFVFSGMLDLPKFLEIAHDLDLLVLLRPGPYICSEWDLGGLPPYLLADPSMALRSLHPAFVGAMLRYFDVLAAQVAPYIGKPVVALQIENEYGAYGRDKQYLNAIKEAWHERGLTRSRLAYFTSDNGGAQSILKGSPFDSKEVLKTINLEKNVADKIGVLRSLQPDAPAMVSEFWSGWFDHWGERHHTRVAEDVVQQVRSVLNEHHASVNLYMFFGGTNFGFMAGANMARKHEYLADVTSYDYDAFLTEYGAMRRDKFLPMQKMLRRFWDSLGETKLHAATLSDPPASPLMSAYAGPVVLDESMSLLGLLDIVVDNRVVSKAPLPMESLGGNYGFVLYRHMLSQDAGARSADGGGEAVLQISGVRDFAYVLADGKVIRTVDRNREMARGGVSLKRISIPASTRQLDIIVENRGRVNYGQYLHDRKGLLGNVSVNGEALQGFESMAMSLSNDHPLWPNGDGRQTITRVANALAGRHERSPLSAASSPPTFFRGEMSINPGVLEMFNGELPGTHIRVFGRGVLWVNGFNVGRFHTGVSGPQRSLFVPGGLLREGRNEFVVLHMNMGLVRGQPRIQMFEQPDFGVPIMYDSRKTSKMG